MIYDVCIIGAGIAGLYFALEVAKKYPKYQICILEKYDYIGGRTATFRHKLPGIGKISWEECAGRIGYSHHNIIKIIDHYGLTKIPITNDIEWREKPFIHEPIDVNSLIHNVPYEKLDGKVLRTHTLKQIMQAVLGPSKTKDIMDRFEYRSELDTARADRALYVLGHEFSKGEKFFIIQEGFGKLIGLMKDDLEKAGVKIMRGYEAQDIYRGSANYSVKIKGKLPVRAQKVIVALTRNAVAKFPCLSNMPILKIVKMRPLVRIYAVFPLKDGKAWFNGLTKFVCPKPVRYVIPINPAQGTIMISYTDGEDAEYFINLIEKSGEKEAMRQIMEQICFLFPDKRVPEPIYHKIHSWSEGCSYWTPGDYDFNKVSKKSVRPLKSMPGVYMCGESWAYSQAWVKCAIDQADHALDAFNFDN